MGVSKHDDSCHLQNLISLHSSFIGLSQGHKRCHGLIQHNMAALFVGLCSMVLLTDRQIIVTALVHCCVVALFINTCT
jgi:hypothetical protein